MTACSILSGRKLPLVDSDLVSSDEGLMRDDRRPQVGKWRMRNATIAVGMPPGRRARSRSGGTSTEDFARPSFFGRTRCWTIWASFALLLPAWQIAAAGSRAAPAPCPGAAAWREAHRDQLPAALAQRDQARTFNAPDLRAELERRFEEDQRERQKLVVNPQDRAVRNLVQHMDSENLLWLKKLLKDNGIPTVSQVGESGVHWTWVLVQHADEDPQLQARVQPIFAQRYEAGELPADDLARLTDRVLLAAGKPQRFGTQFDWYSGQFKPKGAANIADIEANRQALGLMPLADYACMMSGKLKRD